MLKNGLDIAPNPFSAQTTITYTLAEATEVTLTIYDLQGKRIVQPIARHTQE
ncbi:MAG: T9SS type A sorting domain-containing protein, partial [Saprospiraceae bacterium]|nr:T9SS type A sorting domain-containing protein [Saprospiraceae bacterium]